MARAPGVIEPTFLDLGHIAGAAKLTSKGSRADAARAAQIAPIFPAEQTLGVSSDPARDGESAHNQRSSHLSNQCWSQFIAASYLGTRPNHRHTFTSA